MSTGKQKTSKKGTVARNVTLSVEADDFIEEIRVPELEDRSYSKMVDILVLEAKAARQKKPKSKAKK